jgi:cobalamin biosynthesis Co2+ chelatase CbiK
MTAIIFALAAILLILHASRLMAEEPEMQRPAIMLTTSGSVDPNDLKALESILRRVDAAFPCYEVHMAFTCAEHRAIWRKRASDTNFKKFFPWVADLYYSIKNPLTELALIQEAGPRLVLVQPLELIDGQEYHDIVNIVDALRKIKAFDRENIPFPYIGLGNPAMGFGDGQKENLFQMAGVFKDMFKEAEEKKASVVLVTDYRGEANTVVYRSFAEVLGALYEPKVFIGVPQTKFGSKMVMDNLEKNLPAPETLLLGSLSLFMNEEVKEDLFGPSESSWSSVFTSKGYTVVPYMESLCDSARYSDIFVSSLKKMEETVSRRYTD